MSKNRLSELANSLGGAKKTERGYICRCPAHDDHSPSLSIGIGRNRKLVVKCFTGCDFHAVKSAIKTLGYWNFEDEKIYPHEVKKENTAPIIPNKNAVEIWHESISAQNTLAHRYLFSRGWNGEIPKTIRFHPCLRHFSGHNYPALVAAITPAEEKKVYAVHRIYLDDKGKKAGTACDKMSLGPCAGASVKLAPAGEILAVTEGIETGFSVMQHTGLPVWAALSTSGMANLILPKCVQRVIIYADNDLHSAGVKAAWAAAERWSLEGRWTEIKMPSQIGQDFNDVFNGEKNG